jgi:glutathione reductase (NADPH)
MDAYDLIVIGSGTAAQVAVAKVHAAGWSVAVIDHRPFGGTCALRGCDPKKMLVSGEEAVDAATRMVGRGVQGALSIDWPQLMAFKRTFTDPIPDKQEQRYAELGVATFHGLARFADQETIEVDGGRLKARHVLIATGARAIPLGIPGSELVSTSDDFLELPNLPHRIALIGGGYVAAEFSHLAARAGAEVLILQRGPRLLPHFDADLVEWLTPRFQELGISVETGVSVSAVERSAEGLLVHGTRRDGPDISVTADLVVHAAGRGPALDALDLTAGGIAVKDGRLLLNEHLQSTSNPRVYAAGDAAGVGPPLTPVSSHDAKVVAANLLGRPSRKPDYRGVPSVAFTVPPIASVGMDEAAAYRSGRPFRVNAASTPDWFTARRLAERIYGHKVLIDEESDLVLGAHLVGPQADEVINIFGLAIRHGLTAADLRATMFAYPTGASDIGYML